MRVKITIEIERNGYTATETVEYIDRTPADITAEMAGQLQRLQAACNLRDRLRYEADDAMAAGPINHLSDEADAQVVIDKTRDVVEAVNAEMYHLRKAIEDGDEPEDVTARLNDADEAIAYALCHLEDVTSDYTSEPDGY